MTEILNVWIQSVWFWVAAYVVGIYLTYFVLIKFRISENWGDSVMSDNDFASLFSSLWLITIPIKLLTSLFSFIGRLIRKLATSDHLTEDEQKELKKRQSK